MRSFINRLSVNSACKMILLNEKVSKVLKSKNGEGFVDSAVKILMAVVIGALILSGLYLLFKNNILPNISNRINDMFDFQG